MKKITFDGNHITYNGQVFNILDTNVIDNSMTIKLEPIEDELEYNGKIYNIIDKKIDSDCRELVSDITRTKTYFAILPVYIEKPIGSLKSIKFRWLKKVTIIERLYFISHKHCDPEWSGNAWWGDFHSVWFIEDIID